MNEQQFEKLVAKARELSNKSRQFRIEMDAKYGGTSWNNWKATERKRYESLLKQSDKSHSKVFDALEQISTRDWSCGVPCSWVIENITWNIATTKNAIDPPPAAMNYDDRFMLRFAQAIQG